MKIRFYKQAALFSVILFIVPLFACNAQSRLSSADSSNTSSSIESEQTESAASLVTSESDQEATPLSSGIVNRSKASAVSSTAKKSSSSAGSWDQGGTYTGPLSIRVPEAAGTTVYQQGGSCIDASNVSEGYVMVKQSGSSKRLKVQIKKDGKTYNYDLNNAGRYETFPLQMESGTYTVRIMENVTGSSYVQLFAADIDVNLKDSFTAYLYPSQYVNYSASSAAVRKAYGLCMNSKTDLDKVKSVYNFLINNIKYDSYKASTVKSGYLPNVDSTLSTKKGICFDYAALMACMLRSQNVPTRLIVGLVSPNNANHAWNEVYIKNLGWITIKIQVSGSGWKRMDSTFGAAKTSTVESFIGNGKNYTSLRLY